MISQNFIEKAIALDAIAKEDAKNYDKKRFIYAQIADYLKGRVFVGIAGLRGTGKTVILRQLASELEASIYISADSIMLEGTLFDFAMELEKKYRLKYLLIDEIHGFRNWQSELKKIYDFLKLKIIFTSSSSLEITGSKADLSRRAVVVELRPFSFREYIYFRKGVLLGKLKIEEIITNSENRYKEVRGFEADFYDFCKMGALPYTLDSSFPQVIKNVVEKILTTDLPVFGKLGREEIADVRSILMFISRSSIEVCSYSSISKNIGIGKHKAIKYTALLEHAFILRRLFPYGTNITKEPKIVYELPFRAYFSEGGSSERLTGAMREEFFVSHVCRLESVSLNYLKNERGEKLADYVVFSGRNKYIFEIGGSGKTAAQFKGIKSGKAYVVTQPWDGNGIPLLLFGLLE